MTEPVITLYPEVLGVSTVLRCSQSDRRFCDSVETAMTNGTLNMYFLAYFVIGCLLVVFDGWRTRMNLTGHESYMEMNLIVNADMKIRAYLIPFLWPVFVIFWIYSFFIQLLMAIGNKLK